ncbi:MAG: Gfo/Idh/MocA family oxidoreductase [Bacteroidota bacterium]|nr:Gfo/Idh/MocA family oxidoreductase [Bacteroidota bacterium]
MKKIRYGIIGFGNFAERAILPAIRKSENSELVAIQKRSLEQAREKAHLYDIPYYFDSVNTLVSSNNVDAVFIVSANSQHYPETLLAAAWEKHVLVEKPMATSYADAVEMVDACKKADVKFMVGHMLRFSPLLHRIKDIIESGRIGKVSFARSEFIYDAGGTQREWLWNKQTAGGGPLFDIAIHCLDSMRYVLDDTVTSVKSMMRNIFSEKVETTNLLSLQFSQGVIGSIYSSFEAPYRQNFIEFIGSHGSVSAYKFTPSNTSSVVEIKLGKEGGIENIITEEISVPDLYQLEVTHFSDCILNNTEPLVTNESALHNQRILELARSSAV